MVGPAGVTFHSRPACTPTPDVVSVLLLVKFAGLSDNDPNNPKPSALNICTATTGATPIDKAP